MTTPAHSLWLVGVTILFGIPIMLMIVDSAMRSRRRSRPVLSPRPPAPVETWCAGCDRLLPSSQMGWSDDGDYRCGRCLGITTSSGWAEEAMQLRDAQVIPLVARTPKDVCPDCEAFGQSHCRRSFAHHRDAGEPFPFEDWGSSDPMKG